MEWSLSLSNSVLQINKCLKNNNNNKHYWFKLLSKDQISTATYYKVNSPKKIPEQLIKFKILRQNKEHFKKKA